MTGTREAFHLAEAVGASLGGLAAFFAGREERARDHDNEPRDFVLVIAPNSVEVRFRALPNSLPTVQQLGQALAPLCRLDHTNAAQVHVVRHGDAALDTRLPVEAVLCLDAAARIDQGQSTMRVASIAAVAAEDLHQGGAVVRCSLGKARDTTEGLRDLIVEHIHLFACIHGATRSAPLRFDFDVFGRQGTIETDGRVDRSDPAKCPESGCSSSSGTSGFSIRVDGRIFTAAAALWVKARDAPPAAQTGDSPASPEAELVCFDIGGLLPDPIARKAISRAAWKRRGGLTCRTRKGDGALVIQNDNLRVARVVLYLYPDRLGGSSCVANVVNTKDGPEALVRSAINTAISSLQVGLGTAVGEPTVEEAIDQVAACLRRVRARASGGVGGVDGVGGVSGSHTTEHKKCSNRPDPDACDSESFFIARMLRGILLAPAQHM